MSLDWQKELDETREHTPYNWPDVLEGISEDCPYRKRLLEDISRRLSPF